MAPIVITALCDHWPDTRRNGRFGARCPLCNVANIPDFRRVEIALHCACRVGRSGPLLKAEAVGAWTAYLPAPLANDRKIQFPPLYTFR